MQWSLNDQDQRLIDLAIEEDLGLEFTDATTDLLFHQDLENYAVQIINKHPTPIVLAGLPLVEEILSRFLQAYEITPHFKDGDQVPRGASLLSLRGSALMLLKAERVILNFLRHLSAIATLTAQFVEAARGTQMKILDTRKTTPGFRHLEKYAVHCGGGVNHRQGLYDAIMVKDTHIDLMGSLSRVLAELPPLDAKSLPVIVEVRDLGELDTVLKEGRGRVHRVLLDNMSNEDLRTAVARCQGQLETEASGNLHLARIAEVAKTGVDFASVGMITHSAGNVDLSMRAG